MTDANRQTLAQLILARKVGRSFDRLSKDCGGEPAGRRLQQLASPNREIKNFPDPETITALARGLGVSEQEVIHASARSLGLMQHGADEDALTIAGANNLPDDALRALMDLGRVLKEAHWIR